MAGSAYGDPNERRPWILAYAVVFLVVSTLFTALRIFSRFRKTSGGFGFDDAFIIGGWMTGSAFTVLFILGVTSGALDRHTAGIDFSTFNLELFALSGWLLEFLYIQSTTCTKLAVLLFFRRLVRTSVSRRHHWIIWIAIGLTVAYWITFTIKVVVKCIPVEASWMQYNPTWLVNHANNFHCDDATFGSLFSGSFSAFGDAYALVIPALVLTKLKMPRREKIGLYILFGLGFGVVVAGAVRTWLAWVYLQNRSDTWYGANLSIAATAEIEGAIICACVPSLRWIFRLFYQRTKALASGSWRRDKSASSKAGGGATPTPSLEKKSWFSSSSAEDGNAHLGTPSTVSTFKVEFSWPTPTPTPPLVRPGGAAWPVAQPRSAASDRISEQVDLEMGASDMRHKSYSAV